MERELNQNLRQLLKDKGIGDGGMLYLLALHYGLDYSGLIKDIPQMVAAITIDGKTPIYEKNYKGEIIKWNIPLFADVNNDEIDETVKEIRRMFREVNPERAGDNQTVKKKMIWFMNQYGASISDILEIVMIYLDSIDDSQFVMSANNFFKHRDKGSKAAEVWDKIKNNNDNIDFEVL